MFGLSGTELAVILVLALLLLGPSKLPQVARTVGKGVRDFRRATDDLRHSVESEFYRMDDGTPKPGAPSLQPPEGAPVPVPGAPSAPAQAGAPPLPAAPAAAAAPSSGEVSPASAPVEKA